MYKYYKSDFPILFHQDIKRQTSTGETVPVTTDTPFNIRFYVREKGKTTLTNIGYVASYDGTAVHNCTILSANDIMVYIDQSQAVFPPGDLYVEFEFIYPDEHYEGDDENNQIRLYSTGIKLTAEADLHDEGSVTVELFNEIIAREIIVMAEQVAVTAATAKVEEVVTPIAQQAAEKAFESYALATDADIDALWQ